MSKQNVAVFVDFSAPHESQLEAAAAWVGEHEAEIGVYHAYNPSPGYMGYGSEGEGSDITIEEMDCRLQDSVKKLQESTPDSCVVTGTLLQGDPVDKIPGEVHVLKPDIAIMGTHGHGRLHDLFVGSVLQAVLHHTQTPVLAVPPDLAGKIQGNFKTVLAGIDLSDATDRIMDLGAYAAAEKGDTLHLAHVVIPPSTVVEGVSIENYAAGIVEQRTQSAHDHLQKYVDASKDRLGEVDVQKHVLVGPPAQAIFSACQDLNADLLVFGSHGHGIIYSILIGSTAQHLLYHCKVPMLIVPV